MKLVPFKKFTNIAYFKKRILTVSAVCLVAICVIVLSYLRAFDTYEHILLDFRFQLRPVQPYSDKIVIIEISDDTLKELGYWPLPRDFHASLVEVLSYMGTKQIVFDIIFTDSTKHDEVFEQSIKIKQQLGDIHGVASMLRNMGLLYLEAGQLEEARVFLAQAFVWFFELGSPDASTADFLTMACNGSPAKARTYIVRQAAALTTEKFMKNLKA